MDMGLRAIIPRIRLGDDPTYKRWPKLLDNGLRIIICRLGVVDLVEKSIFPTVGHNGDL